MLKPDEEFLFTRQKHDAKRAGLHYDYRFVVRDKAYSFATRKEMPEPGKSIILYEQPVHDASYALRKFIKIPIGMYGAGTTTLEYVKKAKVEADSKEGHIKMVVDGDRFLLKKLTGDQYAHNSWLFRNVTALEKKSSFCYTGDNKYLKKVASLEKYTRQKYREESAEHLEDPVSSVKYDGGHYSIQIDEAGMPHYISRRPSVKGGFPDKTDRVPHLVKEMPQYAGNIYSSELIHTGFDKNELESHPKASGILNSLPTRAIQTQAETGPIRAVLLDVRNPAFNTFREKIEHLKNFEKDFGNSDVLFAPEFVEGHEARKVLRDAILARKGEGVITTDLNLPEEENPRYKEKFKCTFNLRIGSIQQEIDKNGKPKELAGALILHDASGRNVGKTGTGMDRPTKEDFWKNRDSKIGTIIQVECMRPTKSGGKIRSAAYNGEADGDVDTIP